MGTREGFLTEEGQDLTSILIDSLWLPVGNRLGSWGRRERKGGEAGSPKRRLLFRVTRDDVLNQREEVIYGHRMVSIMYCALMRG